jgi:hypothetical protein
MTSFRPKGSSGGVGRVSMQHQSQSSSNPLTCSQKSRALDAIGDTPHWLIGAQITLTAWGRCPSSIQGRGGGDLRGYITPTCSQY